MKYRLTIFQRRFLFVFSLNFLSAVLLAYFSIHGGFAFFEEKVQRLNYYVRGTIKPGHVIIVAIDDKSIEKIGRWPWPRETMANLIEKIALEKPAVIALNILFADDPSYADKVLAEAIYKAGRVAMICLEKNSCSELFSIHKDQATRSVLPQFGDPVLVRDSNSMVIGINVYQNPFLLEEINLAFSLVTAKLADKAVGTRFSNTPTVLRANFLGPIGTIPQISASDVLNGVAKVDLAGKVVLIGSNATGLRFQEKTILGEMDNTEVQANIIETILQDRYSFENFYIYVTLFLLFGIVFNILLSKKKFASLFFLIAMLLFWSHVSFLISLLSIPITPIIFSLIINLLLRRRT